MATLILPSGAHLSYAEVGAGALVILVHGSPGEGRSWARVLKHLPSNLRALVPDLPGYGGSDPLPSNTQDRSATMAAAVNRLVETSADRVWLCGHSYGGNIVLHAALQLRERVAGVLLLEPVFMRALALAGEHEVLEATRSFFQSYVDRIASGQPEAVSQMIDFWFGRGAFVQLPASVQGFLTSAAGKNAEDVKAAFAETLTKEQLGVVERPVLIVHGGASPPVSGKIAVALARLLPRAEVIAIPGATHGMLDSHPETIAELIGRLRYRET